MGTTSSKKIIKIILICNYIVSVHAEELFRSIYSLLYIMLLQMIKSLFMLLLLNMYCLYVAISNTDALRLSLIVCISETWFACLY